MTSLGFLLRLGDYDGSRLADDDRIQGNSSSPISGLPPSHGHTTTNPGVGVISGRWGNDLTTIPNPVNRDTDSTHTITPSIMCHCSIHSEPSYEDDRADFKLKLLRQTAKLFLRETVFLLAMRNREKYSRTQELERLNPRGLSGNGCLVLAKQGGMTSIAQIIPLNVGGLCISVSSGPAKIAEPWTPSPRGCVF
ncbi:hypothetical protein EAG_14539 [Camponotus floridanus]|uniref:Uncharacterized protein n=1 Tax=Camponotus floridanus TaxID=104421 RepID=E2AKJ0_CAMFO|nr:hypothetical protein EAG_14539 [Camponotus floridanus]